MSYEGPHPLPVPSGGTSLSSSTTYTLLAGGTSATGALQQAAAGTSGQVLVSGGASALPTWAASNTLGSLVLLATKNATAGDASMVFTSTISATYSTYFLTWTNWICGTNSELLLFEVSTNNGSTYIAVNYDSSLFIYTYNSTTITKNSSTSYILLSQTNLNPQQAQSGYAWLYNLQNGGPFMNLGQCTTMNTGGPFLNDSFSHNPITAVNAFRIMYGSGTITSGTATLWGLIT
jgi:hypothetical protein